jgi:hypothetical protein
MSRCHGYHLRHGCQSGHTAIEVRRTGSRGPLLPWGRISWAGEAVFSSVGRGVKGAVGVAAAAVLAGSALMGVVGVVGVGPAAAQTDWAGSGFCATGAPSPAPYMGNSYDGVAACGTKYGDDGNSNEQGPVSYDGIQFDSVGFQCVELVMRYMYYDFGVAPYSANGNTVVSNYSGSVFTKEIDPAADGLPSIGDILSFAGTSSNPYGHTSIVIGVSSSSISTLNENDTSKGLDTVPVSKGVVGGGVTGWLHNPSGTLPNGTFVNYKNSPYRIVGGAPLFISNWSVFGGVQPSITLDAAQWGLLNPVPTDGTFINTTGGQVYRIAGGAPLFVSSWSVFGGTQPSTTVDQWDVDNVGNPASHLNAVPTDGTFINTTGGQVYRIAGGAPLFVSSWSVFGGTQPSTTVDQWDVDNVGNPASHLNAVPTDGTFINTTGGQVYRIAGGAPLFVSSWSVFGGTQPSTTVDQWDVDNVGNPASHLNAVPTDGTFINTTGGQVYRIAGGAPLLVSSWSVFGGTQPSTTVDQWDVDNVGNPASHLNPVPVSGTVVEGLPSTNYWTFQSGGLLSTSATSSAVPVPDTAIASFPLDTPPVFTSNDATSFVVGSAGTFTATTSAVPTANFSETGELPSDVTLSTDGTLSGTPAAGTSGTYPITITASNGISPDATQNFTLTVLATGLTAQTITFSSSAPSDAVVGGPSYTVAANGGGSGNPLAFTIDSSASAVCSITGTTVIFIGVGICTIDANQAGNASFAAASQVQQRFSVGPVPSPTITKVKPAKGKPGKIVIITGTNLSGATAVSFNGTSATITSDMATGAGASPRRRPPPPACRWSWTTGSASGSRGRCRPGASRPRVGTTSPPWSSGLPRCCWRR